MKLIKTLAFKGKNGFHQKEGTSTAVTYKCCGAKMKSRKTVFHPHIRQKGLFGANTLSIRILNYVKYQLLIKDLVKHRIPEQINVTK